MRNILGILIIVVVIIAVLIWLGFVDLSPEGEAALDNARENVGAAVENTGEAIRGEGN